MPASLAELANNPHRAPPASPTRNSPFLRPYRLLLADPGRKDQALAWDLDRFGADRSLKLVKGTRGDSFRWRDAITIRALRPIPSQLPQNRAESRNRPERNSEISCARHPRSTHGIAERTRQRMRTTGTAVALTREPMGGLGALESTHPRFGLTHRRRWDQKAHCVESTVRRFGRSDRSAQSRWLRAGRSRSPPRRRSGNEIP
jgi:hypothetical protein